MLFVTTSWIRWRAHYKTGRLTIASVRMARVRPRDMLPNFYKSPNYMNDAKGNEYYQMGDKWFRDRKTPGYGSEIMPNAYNNPKAAEWLGSKFAADSRFAKGAVGFFYKALFQREVLQPVLDTTGPDAAARLAAYNAQQEEFNELAAQFAADGYKVKALLYALLRASRPAPAESQAP